MPGNTIPDTTPIGDDEAEWAERANLIFRTLEIIDDPMTVARTILQGHEFFEKDPPAGMEDERERYWNLLKLYAIAKQIIDDVEEILKSLQGEKNSTVKREKYQEADDIGEWERYDELMTENLPGDYSVYPNVNRLITRAHQLRRRVKSTLARLKD